MVNDRNKMQTHRDGSKKTILCIHIENMSTALGIWSCLCSSISSSSLFSASCCHLFSALSARSTARQLLERTCTMPSPCGHDALAVLARRVLHVSAAFRRGAAAYADGCEQISGHSHLISQCILSGLLDLRAAFYTTF